MACAVFLFSKEWKNSIRAFKTILGLAFAGIFLVYIFSYFNSSDKHVFYEVIKNKLPFLFIPMSLYVTRKLDNKQTELIRTAFILCCTTSSLWSYFQYQQDIQFFQQSYIQGAVLPTLIHHVSFSILVCISILLILDELITARILLKQFVYGILLIWLIYFIHILSVRTGLVLFYLGILSYCLFTLFYKRKIVLSVGLLACLLVTGYFSYQYIPTIKTKIGYTLYGIDQYKGQKDTANLVSDSRRVLSDKIGVELLRKNLWTGVGAGDMQDEMNKIYKERYPEFKPDVYSHIHNQYLYTLAATGLLGGIIFCICLLLPLVYFIKNRNIIFSINYLLLLLVMFWEPFIENQLGTSIYLMVCCLGYTNIKRE